MLNHSKQNFETNSSERTQKTEPPKAQEIIFNRHSLSSKQVVYAAIVLALLIAGNSAYRAYLSRPHAAPPVVADPYLQQEVERTLSSSSAFEHEKISIGVHNGVVILAGTVREKWKQVGAANLASGVAGVTEVKNLIQVHEIPGKQQEPWQSGAEIPAANPTQTATADSPEIRAQTFVKDGTAQLAHKNYEAAIKDFQSALALNANNYEAQSGLQEAQRLR